MKFTFSPLALTLLLPLLIALQIHKSDGWQNGLSQKFRPLMRKLGISFAALSIFSGVDNRAYAEDNAIASTLQALQIQQVESQKLSKEKAEAELLTREILYPEGKLIARGSVQLVPKIGGQPFDIKNFPYGLLTAGDLDPQLSKPEATLFFLAVGREGPPLAARSFNLKDIKFPFVFEITCDDLIFPYTPEAWTRSSNSKDTIAVTAILSADGLLATPSSSEYVGFGLSDPVVVAGAYGRSEAKIGLSSKISNNLYTPEEIGTLTSVDKELVRLHALEAAAVTAK